MVTSISGAKWFKNKADCAVKCSCCGKSIRKGYQLLGVALGEDCFSSIKMIFDRELEENTDMAKFFSVQKMHFDWIQSR